MTTPKHTQRSPRPALVQRSLQDQTVRGKPQGSMGKNAPTHFKKTSSLHKNSKAKTKRPTSRKRVTIEKNSSAILQQPTIIAPKKKSHTVVVEAKMEKPKAASRWTAGRVGELYLSFICVSLVAIGIVYWSLALTYVWKAAGLDAPSPQSLIQKISRL